MGVVKLSSSNLFQIVLYWVQGDEVFSIASDRELLSSSGSLVVEESEVVNAESTLPLSLKCRGRRCLSRMADLIRHFF